MNTQISGRELFLKLLYFIVVIFLIFIIVIPLTNLLLQGLKIFFNSTTPLPIGFSRYIFKVSLNTIQLAFLVTAITLLISIPCAILLSKFKISGTPFWIGCLTIPLITPAFVSGFAIIILFGKSGVITLLLEKIHVYSPSIYGLRGLILTQVLHSIPYAMLILIAGLKGVPRHLEEVSSSFGASILRTQFQVVIPYIRPYTLMAGLMVFLSSMGDVGGPLIIGGNFQVLSTEILSNYISLMDDERMTYVFIFWIIIISFALLFLVNKIPISPNIRYTINNDPFVYDKPIIRKVGLFIISGLLLFLLLPYISILIHSFATVWTLDVLPDGYTLRNYGKIFQHVEILGNTVIIVTVITPIMIFLGLVLSYMFRSMKRYAILNYLTLIPFVLPGVVFGISLLKTYAVKSVFTNGYFNPLILLIFAISIRRLPFVIKTLEAGFVDISRNQEEVAQGLGADSIKVFFSIILPQLKPVINAAILISVVKVITELSASLVINPPGWQSVSLYIAYYVEEGMISRASAMSIILITFVIIGTFISSLFANRLNQKWNYKYKNPIWGSTLLGSGLSIKADYQKSLDPGLIYKGLLFLFYRIRKIFWGIVSIGNAAIIVDKEGNILQANKACLHLICADSLSHLQHATNLSSCLRSGPQLIEWIRTNKPVRDFSTDLFTLNGERICLSVTTNTTYIEKIPGSIELFLVPESLRKRDRREFNRLRELADAAELRSLQAQINPHFLFNTLNGIVELIDTDPQKASDTTQAFADMFRYVLMSTKRDFVMLTDELLHISKYLEIEKVRFNERLHIDWSVDKRIDSWLIPPMILQPIIENAIHHGWDHNGNINLLIRVRKMDNELIISISDTGVQQVEYKDLFTGPGTGLQNVNKRLKTIYGRGLQFEPNSPNGLNVIIKILKDRGIE